ncbi:N-acetylglucosaminyl transferase component Gpi1 [Amniculicola lignicola CBS 123094]|uniref:N-acetylglucosaminyl transferase component Gpi1 n=1 Tax=Amniculicola lignicola CBS 123094 TaxID=1392246 RepID=A0A6A5WIJ2_9PLEO|nr:N-acetylglucosaminyl transferase component Gpi1 [Amniculicola lignicola CBS 123094]
MHAFSIVTLGIFIAGYSTARWDLVTRLYELAIFAWDHSVVTRAAKGFAVLSFFFLVVFIPVQRIATHETDLHPRTAGGGISAREQLRPGQRYVDMVSHPGLMRIFWPSDAPTGPAPGVLVGWRNSDRDLFVVSILQHVDHRNVENALVVRTLFRHSPHPIQDLFRRCGHSSMRVLGTVNPPHPPAPADAALLTAYLDAASRLPVVRAPPGVAVTLQVIIYDRPHPTRMQYLSLAPISLALGDKGVQGRWDPAFEGVEEEEQKERDKKAQLVHKLQRHSVVARPATQQERALPAIIDQVNCAFELDSVLQKNIGLIGRKRALSVGERVVESANDLWDYLYIGVCYVAAAWLYPVAARLFVAGLIAHRVAGEMLLRVLDWRPGSRDAPALKDVSATAQQVDIRLQQFCYWPIQYLTLRKRKGNWESITNSHPEYIRFYNSLWLVANDVIIGIALGSYIIENSDFVAAQVDTIFNTWSIEGLRRMISWLMEWPGGLKLNTELAEFLGDLFLWVIDHWAGCMGLLRPFLPGIIHFIGFSSFAGATMPISLFSDLVSLLTLHIYAFYIASARIFHWQLTIIISLFHLFRGKKRNILRNRIDSCDYDLDQLLLGTILFTLLFFLLPTVFVFYLTFASARVAVIGLKVGLEIGLACLNHFPLFAAMLRIKDSRRLPGGICFDLQPPPLSPSTTASETPISYIRLKSIPLPLRAMFQSYFELSNRIRKHYLSPGVFLYLVSGQFVPPIHRRNLYSLQYSMLPKRRVGIGELWMALNEVDEEGKKESATANASVGLAGLGAAARWGKMNGARRGSR